MTAKIKFFALIFALTGFIRCKTSQLKKYLIPGSGMFKTALFLTTLILLIPVSGLCQKNQSIDFTGGIEYSFRNLTTSSEDSIILKIFNNRNNKESGKFNWRVGFNYNRKLTNKIFLRAGLRVSGIGYKGEKKTDLRWPSEYDGMGGWKPDPNLPHEVQFTYEYWFTEMPVAGRFETSHKKLSPFFELGISPSIYLATRTKTITDKSTETDTEVGGFRHSNKFQILALISFGINYRINDNFQVFGQPAFRYHLTKLLDAPIGEYLYGFGIEIGIRKKIK